MQGTKVATITRNSDDLPLETDANNLIKKMRLIYLEVTQSTSDRSTCGAGDVWAYGSNLNNLLLIIHD